MSVSRGAAVWILASSLVTGCGSSTSAQDAKPPPASETPTAAASTPVVSPKAAYASAQGHAVGRVDYASGEVLYLNPA